MLTRRKFLKNSFTASLFAAYYFNPLSNNLNAKELNISKKRIKTPLLKQNDGTFKAISWKFAYDIMQEQINKSLKSSGVNGISLYTSANISMLESYSLAKLFKAGFRSNNIFTSSHNNEDISSKAKNMIYGISSNSGVKEDILNTDVLLSFDTNISRFNIKNKSLKLINISNSDTINKDAYINIHLKESSYNVLIKYLINQFLHSPSIDMSYLKKHTVFANYKDNKQWEISFKNYKKSFLKYDLNYLLLYTKSTNKNDILKLKNLVLNKSNKLVSLKSEIFNNSVNALEKNLLLESLHLLINKHSRPLCGVFNISNKKSYSASIDLVGLNSSRLPCNRYIKYKQHQDIANKFWNLAKNTLNPISNNYETFIKNINNSKTKFIWLCGLNQNENIDFLNNKKDLFIVSSSSYLDNTNKNANLILPSTLQNETSSFYGDEFRQIKYFAQNEIPDGLSMSLLWQSVELSKRFKISKLYKKVKINNNLALKDVRKSFILNGYTKNTKLYNILFYNKKLKLFKTQNGLNTEVSSDNRAIIGSDGGIFTGYSYNIQEYLFEELRQFSLGNGHDLANFKQYKNSKNSIIWPIVNNKQIKYRFNAIDDIYAKKSIKINKQYSFYGKMSSKNLAFGNLKKITNKEKKSLKYRAKIFTTFR